MWFPASRPTVPASSRYPFGARRDHGARSHDCEAARGQLGRNAKPAERNEPRARECSVARFSRRRDPVITTSPGGPGHHPVKGRVPALMPPCFFAAAALFFVAAMAASPFSAPLLLVHFYAPHILGLSHMLTLGWVSMTMVGVLSRYVPALVKRPLPRPGVAVVQGASFVAGVVGLVVSFFGGWWYLTTAAAALLLLSVVLLVSWLWPLLVCSGRRGVGELGILVASGFFLAAAALGLLLALHKLHPFLGGGMLTNLGAHVALAAVGWVGITACALSFRFIPAFLMPALDRVAAARRQVIALSLLVPVLAAAALARDALVV